MIVTAAVAIGTLSGLGLARAHDPKDTKAAGPPAHEHRGHDHGETPHLHAPVPPEYGSAHVPSSAWTNPALIARGKQIYGERCAVCHGDAGDGKGPAGLALPLRPPDLRDLKMVNEMAGNYWFWRVSEGGAVEPFKSAGSTMPPWKDVLSIEERWAVIVYQHTFSAHEGPHVTSEHPELVAPAAHHAPAARSDAPATGGHKH